MGFLYFEDDKYHYKRIEKILFRRGLKIDKTERWEIHGPHEHMNYQVYVGYAYKDGNPKAKCKCPSKNTQSIHCEKHKQYYCVAIYPKSVYEIDDTEKWWGTKPENRIFTEQTV